MPNFSQAVSTGEVLVGDALKAKIQQSIADEYEAASRYRAIAEASSDAKVKKIMNDVADEVEDMKSSERSKAFASDLTETLGDLEKNIKSLSDQVVKTKNVLRGI